MPQRASAGHDRGQWHRRRIVAVITTPPSPQAAEMVTPRWTGAKFSKRCAGRGIRSESRRHLIVTAMIRQKTARCTKRHLGGIAVWSGPGEYGRAKEFFV
ncbi:MAG: hypothetical protein M0Z53_16380 [Thermaerobacter sp.]|nr:hypothetical protein [Thermaerobacter sp.]